MTENPSHIHDPHEPRKTGTNFVVADETIEAFLADPVRRTEILDRLRRGNPALLGYVVGRAENLAPGDLRVKEAATTLAAEAIAILLAQADTDALESWLGRMEPDDPQAAQEPDSTAA